MDNKEDTELVRYERLIREDRDALRKKLEVAVNALRQITKGTTFYGSGPRVYHRGFEIGQDDLRKIAQQALDDVEKL